MIDRYYIVETFSGAEWDVHHGLLRIGVESFVPHQLAFPVRSRHRQAHAQPMFPGYLFAGVDHQPVRQIETQVGFVRSVMRVAGEPFRVSPVEIERIKLQAQRAYLTSLGSPLKVVVYAVGDWVAIPYGRFKGMPVKIDGIDNRQVVEVSLGSLRGFFPLSALPGAATWRVRNHRYGAPRMAEHA